MAKRGAGSRRKGKVSELEICHRLQEFGYAAARAPHRWLPSTRQLRQDQGDITCPGLVPAGKRIQIKHLAAMPKAVWDSRLDDDGNDHLLTIIKRTGAKYPWLVVIQFDDFLKHYELKQERGQSA